MSLVNLVFLVAMWPLQSEERPSALIAFEEARRSLVSGFATFVVTDARSQTPRSVTYISRFSVNGDRIMENRGDQQGCVYWDDQAERGISKFPELTLFSSLGTWQHHETSIDCDLWKPMGESEDSQLGPAPAYLDCRQLGMYYSFNISDTQGFNCIWAPFRPQTTHLKWKQEKHGETFEVSAVADDGTRVTWWINADKGWNAERILAVDGEHKMETRVALEEHNGVWFPRSIRHEADGRELVSIEITDCSWNNADDTLRFSPIDIGLEPGMNITPRNFVAPPDAQALIWNGENVTNWSSWQEDLRAGRRLEGANILRVRRHEPSPYLTEEQRRERDVKHAADLTSFLQYRPMSQWERYTRDFIIRYSLREDQIEKAMQVLRQCQDDGRRIVEQKQRSYVEIGKQLEIARVKADKDELAKLENRLIELRKPVAEIFEKQLKPRLDRIPTSEQRRQATTSQPTTDENPHKHGG